MVDVGIKGFENLLSDGIPRYSNVLVSGGAGTGKTILGLEYICYGAEKGEPGLFVSLDQSQKNLVEQADRFGWNLKKQIKDNKVSVLDLELSQVDRNLANIIIDEAKVIGAKRIVIDNLALLSMSPVFTDGSENFGILEGSKIIGASEPRQFIYNLIHILEKAKATTFYITLAGKDSDTRDCISEYICDGMMRLRTRSLGKSFLRTIEVLKMRKARVNGGIYTFDITDEGIVVEK
ncbi:MAG: RAD55 family ATPase [Nanobdellota archaeon]